MKIRGRPGEVTASDYAKELAEVLTQRIAMSLPQGDDIVLLDPNEVAKSMESLIVYEPPASSNTLADLLAQYWTGARVRKALGIRTRQALDSRRRHGSILGVKSTDGDVLYPVEQFHRRADGQVEVKPALVPLLRALREHDSWAVGVLLCTPAPELDGLTPFDWAQQKRPAETLERLGRRVAREWSAGAG